MAFPAQIGEQCGIPSGGSLIKALDHPWFAKTPQGMRLPKRANAKWNKEVTTMPMPRHQILESIEDRLCRRWKLKMQQENAAPIVAIGIKQLSTADFGTPVLCTLEDMNNHELAAFLMAIAEVLLKGPA